MALIASGWRQVHMDADENRYVMFDDGVYRLDGSTDVEKEGDEEWCWCESHADDDEEIAHANIGGVVVPLAGPSAEGYTMSKVDIDDDESPREND